MSQRTTKIALGAVLAGFVIAAGLVVRAWLLAEKPFVEYRRGLQTTMGLTDLPLTLQAQMMITHCRAGGESGKHLARARAAANRAGVSPEVLEAKVARAAVAAWAWQYLNQLRERGDSEKNYQHVEKLLGQFIREWGLPAAEIYTPPLEEVLHLQASQGEILRFAQNDQLPGYLVIGSGAEGNQWLVQRVLSIPAGTSKDCVRVGPPLQKLKCYLGPHEVISSPSGTYWTVDGYWLKEFRPPGQLVQAIQLPDIGTVHTLAVTNGAIFFCAEMERAYVLSTSSEEIQELNLRDGGKPGWIPHVGPMWPRDHQSVFFLSIRVAGMAWEKRQYVIQIWNNEGRFLATVALPGFGSLARPGTEGYLLHIDNSQRFYVMQFKDDKPFSIHVYEEKGTLLTRINLQPVYPEANVEILGLRGPQIYIGVTKHEPGIYQIREGIVQVYDLQSGALKGTLTHPLLWLRKRMVPKVEVEKVDPLTSDGRMLFTVHRPDRWEVWEVTPYSR